MTDQRLPQTQSWIDDSKLTRRSAIAGAAAMTSYAVAAQPIARTAITTDTTGLDVAMVKFKTGDIMMNAYRAKPAGKKKMPVVIVVQEIFGVHEWIKDIVRRFARAGFYAIAPDMYQRQGDPTKATDMKMLFENIVSKVPDAQVMSDLDALTRFVGKDGGNGKSIGITGFCWGGRVTWLYAAHNPKLKAGVAWYGRLITKPNALQTMNPIDLVPQLKAPVLGLYGALDKGIPVVDVNAMNAALKAAEKPSSIQLYPGADHGFLADYRPSYNEGASKDAWGLAIKHFQTYLK
jgi:carboxymethylenebutenolidase